MFCVGGVGVRVFVGVPRHRCVVVDVGGACGYGGVVVGGDVLRAMRWWDGDVY